MSEVQAEREDSRKQGGSAHCYARRGGMGVCTEGRRLGGHWALPKLGSVQLGLIRGNSTAAWQRRALPAQAGARVLSDVIPGHGARTSGK
jgi:hypothetical protein